MLSTKLTVARVAALLCAGACLGQSATIRPPRTVSPLAVATAANVEYCFARVRGLVPERLPPAYLALRLHITVAYMNEGARPVIIPLQSQRTIYTALKP